MTEWSANPSWWVPASIVAGIALIGAGVKIALWAGKVNSKLDSLGEGLAEVRKSFGEGLAEVRKDIKKILERQAPPPVVRAGSPVRLTDFGEKISAAVSAKEWAADHASRLTAEASGKQEFEVFEMCVAYVAEQFDRDESLQRKSRAAAYDLGIETEQIRKVYEVELRDRILLPRPSAALTG